MEPRSRESTDLLSSNQKREANGNLGNTQKSDPPDGGFKAYAVMIGSFLTNGLLFGVINSYSVIYTELVKELKIANVPNPESRASLVGALTMGTTFLLSPVSGVLTGLMGLRLTAVVGGTIATAGLLITSFVVDHINALSFTYGIMYGIGASFAYTPSLAVLGHYFKKYLGFVNGVVTIGSSIFTIFMPIIMDVMIKNYGLPWMFRLLALFTCGIAFCGLLFNTNSLTTAEKPIRENKNISSLMKSIFCVDIWKNKKYRLWATFLPIALFGYFVPYVHIKSFIQERFQEVSNKNLPLQCIAITSGIGRLVFGYLADKPGIDRIFLQQISFYVIGGLTIILPFVQSFPFLVVISLGVGLFDGAFISLIGPIAFEIVGGAYAAQAIGCLFGLAAFPLSIGPAVAGYLYSLNESYTLPFVLAGISPIVGATSMFLIRLHRNTNQESEVNINGHLPLQSVDVENSPYPAGRK
ncbi:unnamed protein product [Chilo suppressalis]|uniref:Major facilitator superfamily (MFS) profile domain-containing protein n=1 Tax=Chilo suppressalis TaxID=168631 RepID=A0ABN8AXM2_CHISP|nr:hypothetical protein evm_010510 [Chilo suppressalis]CAH0399843.1 unnamed protein product [Chilo suppressalis]